VFRRAPLIAVALILATRAVAFAARTDAIILRNGDHITGEVIQMRQGKLQVKTDDAGTLSIEWDKIASISTADQYDVMLRDGTRRLGFFRPGVLPNAQILSVAGALTPLPMVEIASFERIQKRFIQRLDGSFDLGGSYTQSTGIVTLYLDASATYRRPSYAYGASFATNLTRQPDQPDASRYSTDVSYTRFRNSGWLISALGLFESNRDLGFSFRSTGAGTLGRYLARTRRVELLTAGGLAVGREVPVDAPTVTNVDALIVSGLSVFTYDYPSTRIDLQVLVFPSLDDPGRVRVNANGKLKRELFKDFYVSLSAYDAFDNRPKSASATKNDVGASLSFGWSF
jgi:Protein of unknown function, DUF481